MEEGYYGIVRNIPEKFHSSELRNFFTDAVENEKFMCFHFKHRPEINRKYQGIEGKTLKAKSTCGVFLVKNEQDLDDIINKYNNTNWINENDDTLKQKCVINRVTFSKTDDESNGYLTRKEQLHGKRHATDELFSKNDIASLSELRPPKHVMPNGNVGTPTSVFLKLIKDCSLPPKIIKKLKLTFPTTGSTRRYGNVPHKYESTAKVFVPKQAYTATGEAIGVQSNKDAPKENDTSEKTAQSRSDESESDDDGCEEWERHEALHNDVTSQERTKERLFEEKIELKWEKGGSGLVFYTDAQHWAAEEGDFDEETADDWDVDMGVYYGEKGDMDAEELLQIRNEKRLREGLEEIIYNKKFKKQPAPKKTAAECKLLGEFEAHTKGVGRKVLAKHGWKDGNPLGVNRNDDALKEPVEAEGQHPKERKGFGYRGEKLRPKGGCQLPSNHRFPEPLASHSYNFPQFAANLLNKTNKKLYTKERKTLIPGIDGVIITTNKDGPLDVDISDGVLRSQHDGSLKHRQPTKTKQKSELNNSQQTNVETPTEPKNIVYSGSKLVNPKLQRAVDSHHYEEAISQHKNNMSILSVVNFVKGGLLK